MLTLTVKDILSYVDDGLWAIPELFDYYTWRRKDVVEFFEKLYCNRGGDEMVVLADAPATDDVSLIIKNSLIVNTLYSVFRGVTSPDFSGDAMTCTGLWFNYETTDFAFYDNSMEGGTWVSVTDTLTSTASRLAEFCLTLSPLQSYNIMRLYDTYNNTFNIKHLE
ncbi:MAG: hypothetical protein J5733_05715 [Bacteroidaceae bacterium]|nr:hypothetical protein [Bacteroidaceae bacterium]